MIKDCWILYALPFILLSSWKLRFDQFSNLIMVQIKRSLLKSGKNFNIKVILLKLKSWMSKYEHEHFRSWIFTTTHKNFGIRGIGIFLELHPQQSKTKNMSRLIISSTYVVYKLQCYKQYRMRCLMKKKVKM